MGWDGPAWVSTLEMTATVLYEFALCVILLNLATYLSPALQAEVRNIVSLRHIPKKFDILRLMIILFSLDKERVTNHDEPPLALYEMTYIRG